ncbi:MAG: ABC transporter ATP-binding protein [Candidatus Dormibacteria bacterium]
MDALRFDRLGYRYPSSTRAALADIDLALDGGLTLLAGDSGSGKSTLLRVCNGLIPHFHGGVISGAALVFGQDVTRTTTRRLARQVGFVFQDPELQAVQSRVERDVAFGLENLQVPPKEMRDRVDEALELCGIAALRARTVSTLSGGERQRLALAGVLAMRPALLVFDEPLSQLDPAGALAVVDAMAAAMRGGATVLVAEHRVRLLQPLATRSVMTREGRLGAGLPATSSMPAATPEADSTTMPGAGWRLHRVTAGHGRTPVLHDLELGGAGGEVIALTGANGSGKTTLLRTIAGLLPPLTGRVERDPGRVAYLPQNPTALLHRQTLRDEVAWTLRHDRGGPDAESVLREFALTQVGERYPRDLSTGERQRAALAAALAGAPVLALLDEPTRGMDPAARAVLSGAVRRLARRGTGVVLATHDAELAGAVASRVLELRDGGVHEQRRVAVAAT